MAVASKRRVLIAEDDGASRMVLQSSLEEWGYAVVAACNGAEGWHMYLAHRDVRLAVLDWMMPELDGLELTRRIRQYEQRLNLRSSYIIMLTTQSGGDQVLKAQDAGVDDYIRKGSFRAELQSRLRMAEEQIAFENTLGGIDRQQLGPDA